MQLCTKTAKYVWLCAFSYVTVQLPDGDIYAKVILVIIIHLYKYFVENHWNYLLLFPGIL
jgi:hypothetical protein